MQLGEARVPDGERIYAIGDIHGRADLLSQLMAQIWKDCALHPKGTPHIVFIGDYIDRGPDSKDAIDRLIKLRDVPPGLVKPRFLRGNHDQFFLDYLATGDTALWLYNGGATTFDSYGGVDLWPESHVDFFHATQLSVTIGGYHFVHAGVRPGVSLDMQTDQDRLWIRSEFLMHTEPFDKVIIHGHTPSEEPEVMSNRINIDTMAYRTGHLTALRLEGNKHSFLATGEPSWLEWFNMKAAA